MRKMKKDRFFGLSCFIFLYILNKVKSQGNFEDADKLSDLMGGNSGQHFDLRHTIPGIPEVDYPIYSHVPKTSFECTGRHEGYYADIESRCQAFRICTHTARSKQGFGFLCPNGTLFSQQHFVCDWYRNVDCDDSERFYSKNDINRVGSSFDMMETVRQIMEYPMKTISKALQQNPGSSRKPTQAYRGTSRGTQASGDINNESETVRSRQRTGSSRKSVTRDQVESAHNRGSTKYGPEKDVTNSRAKEETTQIHEEVASGAINDKTTIQTESTSSSDAKEDVYVNSLGELSTDPGVTFDRTNAHIIAEPHRYRYEKYNMNFAEKVNAGLNDFIDLPANENLAPDYVKTIRNPNGNTPRIDLPSNINGLLDEIANDLNPSASGYQVPKPAKAKHAFRFLSRGFSSQEDPYKYKKPKQTASTIRFTPNQLPIEREKSPKKPALETAVDAVPFGHSTESPATPETLVSSPPTSEETTDYPSPSIELSTLEDVPYLSPPILEPNESTTDIVSTEDQISTTVTSSTAPSEQEAQTVTPDTPAYAALVETTALPLTTTTETPHVDTSTAVPDVAQNLITSAQKNQNQKFDAEDTPIDEDRIDVNRQAESLFISGLQLTSNENNTEVTTVGTTPAQTPLLIQVAEDHSYLTAWITSTALPPTEAVPTINPDTQPEQGSLQERIRNYRRLANLQRASAKPLIYGKRAGLRMTKMTTMSTTTPKPASTTQSYLKRVAASRLRLSRLTAAAGNKQNHASFANTPAITSVDNAIDPNSNKKLSIRNIEKETDITGNSIGDSTASKNSGVVTWESVKNSLQRFQVKPKLENDVNTTIGPRTSSTSISPVATTRNTLPRKRNRVSNIRTQQTNGVENDLNRPESISGPSKAISTSMSISISSSSSSSPSLSSSALNLNKPSSLNFLNIVPLVPPAQPTLSIPGSQAQKDITSSTSGSSNSFVNEATADNTNLNSKSATASNTYISFDKLTRSIVGDSILQNYRAGPILGRSSLASSVNSYQPPSTLNFQRSSLNKVNSSPARSSLTQNTPVTYTKIPTTVASQVTPSQRPAQLPSFPSAVVPTTSGPRIVVARAEGQRIEPNNVSSIISSLITQQEKSQPKPTPSTSYVPLNDFLTKKFGNQVKNTVSVAPTSNYNAQQYQQQQQQQQAIQSQILPLPVPQLQSQPQPQSQQQQQQRYQQTQNVQHLAQKQYQQTKANSVQQYQQKPQQIFQSQQQQQQQQPPYHQISHQQQQFTTLGQQKTQNNYYQSAVPFSLQQSTPQTSYLEQNQPQTLLNHQSMSELPSSTSSLQPLITQNIFATFKQQQQQLPAFPPLRQPQSQSSQSLQQFDGNNNYLNVPLPSLTNGLIPAPINQNAQKRTDIAIDNLELTDFEPAQSVFTGATSYDVPLSSIGRLPNDIQALFRRLRKY